MGSNAALAAALAELADLSEITGANAFKVNAFRRAFRSVEGAAPDLCQLARSDPGALAAIDGIGDGLARRIGQFAATGTMEDLVELRSKVPPGLPALLRLQGMGPKTVKLLWEQAGVTDAASLKEAIDSGRLDGLAGFGKKKVANLAEALTFAEESSKRWPLGEAYPVALGIVERLSSLPGTQRCAYAGSLRRGRETVGDIDILVCSSDPAAAAASFCAMPGVAKVLAHGATRSSIRTERGLQVDLRTVPVEAFGAALLYFTGSKEHNVALRERANARGQTLNEYGLFPDDGQPVPQDRGIRPVAAATEEEIYAALGLPFLPPELREAHGELELTATPRLIEVADIRAELHAHTTESDGELSLRQLIEAAKSRGFHTIAVTDHSVSSVQANGLSVDRLLRHIDAVRAIEAQVGGIRVLAGSEVDIKADGSLDYADEILAKLDLVVASPHAALKQEPAKATERLLRAVRHPLVHILGHPTGRIINGRPGLSPDMPALLAAAAESGTALEVNSHWLRLDLRDADVRAALAAGAMIAIDCDVHGAEDFDNLRFGVATARRGGLTTDRCVNCLDAAGLERWRTR